MTYLLKIFNFGTLKVMKTCPVIRFLGTFCPGIRFFGEILPGLSFALAAHPYLPLLGSRPPPPPPPRISSSLWVMEIICTSHRTFHRSPMVTFTRKQDCKQSSRQFGVFMMKQFDVRSFHKAVMKVIMLTIVSQPSKCLKFMTFREGYFVKRNLMQVLK